MNEELFLKKFARALGAEDTLTKIEQKKVNEEKMLKVPITLFDLIKEEMSRTVPDTVNEPPPAINEERRPKTLQEHLAVTKPIKI